MKNKITSVLALLMLLGMVGATFTVAITVPDGDNITTTEFPYLTNSSFGGNSSASATCTGYVDGAVMCAGSTYLGNVTKACTIDWSVPTSHIGAHTFNLTCVNASATASDQTDFTVKYGEAYTESDVIPIVFDALGTGGTFIVQHITVIGQVLLALFVMGSITLIIYKLKQTAT